MRRVLLVLLGCSMIALAACGGGGGSGSNVFVPAPTGEVSFIFVVPTASTGAKPRPNITVPSNAASVGIKLASFNGTASTGVTPTVANLSSTASGCQQTSAQLSCAVTVSGPVGALVYTVSVYSEANAGGSPIATGNVAVTTTAGTIVSAPATLGGTVAKLVLTVSGIAELGNPSSVAVTVQAEDSNGNTILGTYNAPVTLTDTDATGQTTISPTSVPDSTTAATVALAYLGGAMASSASIGASLGSITATPATFLPDATNPTVNDNTVTFAETYQEGYAVNASPTPGPTSSSSYSYTYQTGQNYNGVSNAVYLSSSPSGAGQDEGYYAWIPKGSGLALGYLGVTYNSEETYNCASPYDETFVLPLPTSWNVYQGSGACTYAYNYYNSPTYFETESQVYNADGSYTAAENYNYTFCCAGDYGSESFTVGSDASGVGIGSYASGSTEVSVPVPASGSTTVSASLISYPSGTFPPSPSPGVTPTPLVTTAPNPWLAAGVAGGTPPIPLQQDTMTVKSTSEALPAQCAVPQSITGSASPTVTEIDEAYTSADPLSYDDFYYTESTQHYFLSGVGEICYTYSYNEIYFDEGAYGWYSGSDQELDECSEINTSYVTASTLVAEEKRRAATSGTSTASANETSALLSAAVRQHIRTLRAEHIARARARLAKRLGHPEPARKQP